MREAYDEKRSEQKEVDVALACEMVSHAFRNSYDVAILISGDRDFIPAIQHVQASGKKSGGGGLRQLGGEEMKRWPTASTSWTGCPCSR